MPEHGGRGADVERVVARPQVSDGFKALEEMGLKRYAFEAVVLRHPELFSPDAVEICVERVKPLRFAEANGGYDVFFKQLNDRVTAVMAR